MGPETTEHKEVQIRYGYDIVSDLFYAHATIPNVATSGLPKAVRREFRVAVPGKKHTDSDADLQSLLRRMKSAIDDALAD
jgi:hypothetical protein